VADHAPARAVLVAGGDVVDDGRRSAALFAEPWLTGHDGGTYRPSARYRDGVAHSRTRRLIVRRVDDGTSPRAPDEVAVEEPLEILLDGHPVTTTMRTPGHDHELAVGFAHAEGMIAGVALQGVRSCGLGLDERAAFNRVDLWTGGQAPVPTARLSTTS